MIVVDASVAVKWLLPEPGDAATAMGLWLQTLPDGVIGLVADEADLVTALGLAMEARRW